MLGPEEEMKGCHQKTFGSIKDPTTVADLGILKEGFQLHAILKVINIH